nr:MAG TPA: hypothetical protein [Caudoviricetes sp.]
MKEVYKSSLIILKNKQVHYNNMFLNFICILHIKL